MSIDLETNSYLMQPLKQGDLELYLSAFLCERTTRFIEHSFTKNEVIENFENILNSKREIYYSIFYKLTKRKIGFIGVSVGADGKTAELGFMLIAGISPKGTAKHTAIMLINYLFRECELSQIKFVTAKGNLAAIRACKTIHVDFSQSNRDDNPQIGYLNRSDWKFFDFEP